MSEPLPIIDSHIHLYPSDALDSLAWHTGPDHPLTGRHSLAEYAGATGSPAAPAAPAGFVLVEADRKNDEARDWTAPLQEVSWMRRIADGHDPAGARLCRAMVPWAPVVLGPARLEAYLQEAEAVAGPAMWARVKGFRYLLQDKPAFTALADGFIEGLKVLGKRGFVFDLAVDQHRRGRAQMEEAVEMVDRAHEGVPDEEKVVFVLSTWNWRDGRRRAP